MMNKTRLIIKNSIITAIKFEPLRLFKYPNNSHRSTEVEVPADDSGELSNNSISRDSFNKNCSHEAQHCRTTIKKFDLSQS